MLKKTALSEVHREHLGKMVDFGGWDLPVQYPTGVLNEHLAVRNAAGLFDVSHMGEILVRGRDALTYLQFLLTNDLSQLAVHQAIYSAMCNDHGGIVDDLVIYRITAQEYFCVVNASNTDKDFAHFQKIHTLFLKEHPAAVVEIQNQSQQFSQLAIQGPKAAAILQTLTTVELAPIQNYWCKPGSMVAGIPTLIARTGYTGEDGFELYVPWADGPVLWKALIAAGKPFGLIPCGLGARDTLRLEMKYALYGNELNDNTSPLETGLAWVTKLSKENFVGKSVLLNQKSGGIPNATVGIMPITSNEGARPAIPRSGYEVWDLAKTKRVGVVTSGTQSPSLNTPIGVVRIEKGFDPIGTRLMVKVRDTFQEFEVVKTPFFKHNGAL